MSNTEKKTRIVLSNGSNKLIAKFKRRNVLMTLFVANYLAHKHKMPVKQIKW